MTGYTFNQQLFALRLSKGLSRKEVSRQAHVFRVALYLYEKGYLRPRGKDLAKLESFYDAKIDFSGEKDYPAEIEETKKTPGFVRKKRVLVFGILSAVMAAILATGAGLFVTSTKNDASFYGPTYTALYQASRDQGKAGTEIVTNASYHYLISSSTTDGSILFYDSSSLLHFNECHYGVNIIFTGRPEIGNCRIEYRFGGDLGSDSHRCYFSFGSVTYGNVISFEVLYYGEAATKFENYRVHVQGEGDFSDETLLYVFNYDIIDAVRYFDNIVQEYCGEGKTFLKDFLPDREKGRNVALLTQILGLALLGFGLLGLFVGLTFLSYFSLANFRPKQAEEEASKGKELPKDLQIPFIFPDFALLALTRALFVFSLLLLAVSFLGKVGVGLPALFYNEGFLSFLRTSFRITPFLWLWLTCRSSNGGKILAKAVKSFLIFFFLAAAETALIALTNAWGYDFSELIFDYVPGSVFQAVALLFLVHFFLSFTPAFLQSKGRGAVVLWRCLSLLPLSLLIASVIISNAHILFFDVKKNIYVSFWFPSSALAASIISVLLLYGQFFLRLFFKRRYGGRASYYFNGNFFALWSNLLVVLVFLLVYVLILLLRGNEYAYYLGLINGEWILTLIPFFLLCKNAANSINGQRLALDLPPVEQ